MRAELVQRLRDCADNRGLFSELRTLLREAADEIEALRSSREFAVGEAQSMKRVLVDGYEKPQSDVPRG